MPENIRSIPLYNLRVIAVFNSITLLDYRSVFKARITTINYGRNAVIILVQINAYRGSIQSKLRYLFNISHMLLVDILAFLLEQGLITTIKVKRRTNISALIAHVGYSITPQGRELLQRFDLLLSAKVAGLRK